MSGSALSRLWYPPRLIMAEMDAPDDVAAFIESRSLDYSTRLEDDFVERALTLGVESGTVLEVGARVGLILLRALHRNENLVGIGLDTSGPLIERARETAVAWDLADRAVFQVGDARRMRFKAGYFDLVVSDRALHRFDDAASVLAEIARVLKPKGALLVRDYQRPNRLALSSTIRRHAARWNSGMGPQLDASIRAAYTAAELRHMVRNAGLRGNAAPSADSDFIFIEQRGETDPGSWVTARDQYR
ncbi:MAG TPA: class I SAM-dependent methyltransferase [Terriglobia bacterium]|nr:class I SAM-dependent methyltransferase [Terriglobia bacterium]